MRAPAWPGNLRTTSRKRDVAPARYRDWVVSLAFRLIGDRETALDVLQETFAYVLRKFPGFKLTARFTTFLYPVVRHVAIAQRRKAQRLVLSESPPDPEDNTPGPEADTPRERLTALMENLPEAQRETLLLRYVESMSLEEIAEALDVPVGTVKSRINRGRVELARRLQRKKKQWSAPPPKASGGGVS